MGPKGGASHRPLDHDLLDLADRLGRIESLRADVDAIHDRVATEEAVRILEVVEARSDRFVARVGDEAVGGEQPRRSHELVGIPPERGACRRATGAEDALVESIQLFAVLGRLQPLLLGRRGIVDEIRLDRVVLLEELAHVDDQVANHGQPRQGAGSRPAP